MRRKIILYNPKLKELARQLRKNMTLSEVLLWNELKGGKMMNYDFDRQHPIDEYIVDFYCKDLQLALEIDGSSHRDSEVFENDDIRQIRLEALGISFLRFDDLQVKKDIEGVLKIIENWILEYEEKNQILKLQTKIPTPSPSEEGS